MVIHEDEDAESDGSDTTDVSEDERSAAVPRSVKEDIAKFEDSFRELTKRYRLINRIGEGMSDPPSTPGND